MSSDLGGIFISYRREDTAGAAGRLYDRLCDRFGEDFLFMDVGSIDSGVDFTESVLEAVSGCDVLVVLIGRDWLRITDAKRRRRIDNPDDWVRVEIETALQRDIPVIPVLVDGAVLPEANVLAPSLQPLCRRQALQLSHTGFQAGVAVLVEAIEKVFGNVQEPAKPPKPIKPARRKFWRLNLLDHTGAKSTFRLSAGREIHEITITLGTSLGTSLGILLDEIEVDGEWECQVMQLRGQELNLRSLGGDVAWEDRLISLGRFTIQVNVTGDTGSMAVRQVESVIVRIGDDPDDRLVLKSSTGIKLLNCRYYDPARTALCYARGAPRVTRTWPLAWPSRPSCP
jgi:hypothetical protein